MKAQFDICALYELVIAMSAYIVKIDGFHINILMLQLQILDK